MAPTFIRALASLCTTGRLSSDNTSTTTNSTDGSECANDRHKCSSSNNNCAHCSMMSTAAAAAVAAAPRRRLIRNSIHVMQQHYRNNPPSQSSLPPMQGKNTPNRVVQLLRRRTVKQTSAATITAAADTAKQTTATECCGEEDKMRGGGNVSKIDWTIPKVSIMNSIGSNNSGGLGRGSNGNSNSNSGGAGRGSGGHYPYSVMRIRSHSLANDRPRVCGAGPLLLSSPPLKIHFDHTSLPAPKATATPFLPAPAPVPPPPKIKPEAKPKHRRRLSFPPPDFNFLNTQPPHNSRRTSPGQTSLEELSSSTVAAAEAAEAVHFSSQSSISMGTSAGASASAQSSGTYADGDVASSIASAAVRRKRSRKQRRRKRGNSSAKSAEGSSSSNTLADLQSHEGGGAKGGGIDVHAMQANVGPLTVALVTVGAPEGDGNNPCSSSNTNNSIAEDIGIITANDGQQESEEMLVLHPASRTASLYSVVPARSIAPSSPQLAAADMYNANAYSERCSMHPGLRNDMWCEDCSAAICDHCTTSGTHHQGHIVAKLSAAYDDTFEAIEEMQLELMDRLAETRQRHTLLDSERTLLNDTYEMAQELIEEQAKTDGDHIGMQFNVAEIALLSGIKACTLWREHIDEAVELVQKMIEEFPQAQAVAERGRFVDLLAAATEARPDNWDQPLPKARAMLDHVQPPSSEAALVVPRVMDLGRKRGHLRVAGEPFSAHGLAWQIEAKRARNRDGQSALYASLSCVEGPDTGMPHMVSVHLAPASAGAGA
ncbi:hypothetical protein LPJ66_001030, partial [Kickxella alabastrina]